MKFSELNLHPALFSGIEKQGFTETTPIQELTIPPLLEGKDVAGLAQTGTGKTAAFLLPLMERIVRAQLNPDELSEDDKALRAQRAFPEWRANEFVLVLVPTRELAEQVYENALMLKGESNLRAVSIYGGVGYEKQKEGLRQGVEFVIATPGRLIDLFKEHLVDLKQVRAIVFDEADRMFDMGFKDDMKFILQRVPKDRQFLVFSATLNLDVLNTAYQFGANPVEVNVSRDQAKAENVEDKIFHVGQDEKGPHLLSLLKLHKPRQTIVFSNFKMNVSRLAQFLNENGMPAVGISSLLTQSQRNRVMEQFKGSSDHNILVATDVAARGLDIKGVDMVVNFELPDDPENYVHRIGRTGRAGEKGIAFSLVSDRDVDALSRVEQYLKHRVDVAFLEEQEIIKEFKPMPPPERERSFSGAGPRGESRGPRPEGGGARGRRDGGRGGRSQGAGRDGGRGDGPRGESSRGETSRGERRPRREGPTASAAGGDSQPSASSGMNRTGGPSGPSRPTSGARGPTGHGPRRGGTNGGAANGSSRGGPGRRDRSGGPESSRPEGRSERGGADSQSAQGRGRRYGGRTEGRPDGRAQGRRDQRDVGGASGHAKPLGKPGQSKSLGGKVSGFFKRLFGG